MRLRRSSLVSVVFGSKESPMTFKNIIQRKPGKEFVKKSTKKFTRKCLGGIALFVETRAGVCCRSDCGESGADGGF